MKIAAISCARMASTRFHGKCLAPLNGKRLIQDTIDFAKEIDIPLYIWTRDKEIMEYVSDKCPIIYEPEHLYDSKGEGSQEEKVRIRMAYANKIIDAHYLVLLQPTQPMRSIFFIKCCIDDISKTGLDYAFTSSDNKIPDGKLYVYSHYYLETGEQRFWAKPYTCYNGGTYFDIDTKEDLERCEKWLQRRA